MSETLVSAIVLVAVAIAAYVATRFVFLPLVYRAADRTALRWDDVLTDHKVLNRLALLPPLIVLRLGFSPTFDGAGEWLDLGERLIGAALVVASLFVISAVLNASDRIYAQLDVARERPIKGYLQVAVIVVWVVGAIVTIAVLADQEIGVLLGGLGAFSAVVILVFRDTILSLVASVQLTNNDMLAVGDWLEMPSQNADGDVIEIALHTIKVQNWDKTITTIPTYKLISDSFKNWRGMTESGGRRIKRSLMIDVNSIRFLRPTEMDHWRNFAPLAEYMDRKKAELTTWNTENDPGPDLIGDPRRLTNLGTFRAYVDAYLDAHPRLAANSMTKLVRQLQPTEHGLPLELYVFTNTTEWGAYEAIQADIFDHLMAIIDEFGLKLHQAPTGRDISSLSKEVTA